MLAGSMLLTGLIAGPKEPQNINPYVDVLVNDLIDIGKLTLYDAYKDERFKLKTSVLYYIRLPGTK